MDMKFLILVALLKIASSIPAPDPDHDHNIEFHIDQTNTQLQLQSGCCCNDDGCHCKDKEGSSPTKDPPPSGCKFGGKEYKNGDYLEDGCFHPQCIDGTWKYTGKLDNACGKCYFGGEPLIYTFDNLQNAPVSGMGRVFSSNLISFNKIGEYVMTQPGFVNTAGFGVTGHFTAQDAAGGQCSATTLGYTNCINGIIYYEDNSAVKIVLDSWGIFKVYWHAGYEKWGSDKWGTSIDMNSGVATLSGAGGVGEILVIEAPNIIMGGRECTIIIGSKGFTVTLCKEDAFSVPGYPWSGIYAMPSLKSPTATPVTSPLYGLCNTWTGENQVNFWTQTGISVPKWQCGLTEPHQGGLEDIRLLCYINPDGSIDVANTWEVL